MDKKQCVRQGGAIPTRFDLKVFHWGISWPPHIATKYINYRQIKQLIGTAPILVGPEVKTIVCVSNLTVLTIGKRHTEDTNCLIVL